MAEYIEREKLIKKFCNHCYFDVGEKNCAEDCFDVKIINSIPTADVQPVKHSRWKLDGEPPWYVRECPECYEKWFHWSGLSMPNYCPNCGAKMDGDDNG